MNTESTFLPGIGTGYTLRTHHGQIFAVICYRTGERKLLFYGNASDPHAAGRPLTLTASEAHELSALLRTAQAIAHLGEAPDDPHSITVAALPLTLDSPWHAKHLADLIAATTPAAAVQIVAVIRGQHVHANPGPEFVLASSDTIIAAATLPTITTLAAHLAAPAP